MRHPPVSARCPGEGPRRRLLLPLPSPRTRCVGGEAWLCGSVSPAHLTAARVPHPLPWLRPARSHVFERGLSVCITLSPASHPSALKRLRGCQRVATVPDVCSPRATGLRLRPGARSGWRAAGGLPSRLPSSPTAGGEGRLRGTSRGDTGARRGDAGGWARVKSGFDNHLEGSSIKRYSEVAEAMTTLQYHPIEETGDATIRWDCSACKQPCRRVAQ